MTAISERTPLVDVRKVSHQPKVEPQQPKMREVLADHPLLIGGLTTLGGAAGAIAGWRLSPIIALIGGTALGTTAYAAAFELASRLD